ncbi:MAG TPA: transcriptional repressor [Alphaproteobacteria bacterium]|nr:transcriptional repressor [Alphaproteobacteria bacterium]
MTTQNTADLLRLYKLRPTRQRVALAALLFDGTARHVTAETLHGQVKDMGITLSLATIYNTLHQFTKVGLLKEIRGIGDATWFDTNIDQHHHFFDITNDHLIDIPASSITISNLPDSPQGKVIDGIDVIVRLSDE